MSDLIVDANIAIGALFGRSLPLLADLALRGFVLLMPTEQAREVASVVPALQAKGKRLTVPLERLWDIIDLAPSSEYDVTELNARKRLLPSGQPDWPVLALAITLGAPILTRDVDLFGTGVAVWHPRNIDFAEPETAS